MKSFFKRSMGSKPRDSVLGAVAGLWGCEDLEDKAHVRARAVHEFIFDKACAKVGEI